VKGLAALVLALGLFACSTPNPVEQALAQHQDALRQSRPMSPGLLLGCEPKDAEVLLDGVLQGSCEDVDGQVLSLSEGVHRVEVRKAGHRSYQAQVSAGQARTRLTASLSPAN
jgi:hypothetical protein